jgi:hypothetical protein
MQDKQNYGKHKQYYRIRYPLSYRPKVRIQGENLESDTVGISEQGVRFYSTRSLLLMIMKIEYHVQTE